MGAYLSFVAFRNQPDLAKLAQIEWLKGYRLFKHRTGDEWYLERPSPDPDAVDLSARLVIDNDKFSAGAGPRDSAIADIRSFLLDRGLHTYSLDDEGLRQALRLSTVLDTSALLAYGDDEGADAGFVCEKGRLTRARLMVDAETVLDIDAGAMRVVPQGQELYRVANQVAAAFFGWQGARRISSDPFEIDQSDFDLIASNGAAQEFRPPGQSIRDQLSAIDSGEGSSSSKLRRYAKVVDGHVAMALKRALLNAERQERNSAETQITACYVPSYYEIYENRRPLSDELNRFLSDVAGYFRALRPKPQYRRKIAFDAVRRRLKWRWKLLKLRIALDAWFRD